MTTPPDLAAAAQQALVELHRELKGVKPTKAPLVADPFAEPAKKAVKGMAEDKEPKAKGTSPVTLYVRSLPGGPYKTALEVAQELGCSVQAIRKYAKNKVTQAPSFKVPFGDLTIYLYTKDDVKALRDYIGNRRQVVPTDGAPLPEPTALRRARG